MNRVVDRKLGEYLAAVARAGGDAAFERLVIHWQPRLIAHAFRLSGDAELARDVVQDAWIGYLQRLTGIARCHLFFPPGPIASLLGVPSMPFAIDSANAALWKRSLLNPLWAIDLWWG